jgi:hypothetical protein
VARLTRWHRIGWERRELLSAAVEQVGAEVDDEPEERRRDPSA